jgi:hypothetical protein
VIDHYSKRGKLLAVKGGSDMARQGRQAVRKPATKFAQLRKKMEKNMAAKIVRKKK